MRNQNIFLFRKSWGEDFQALPDEEAGRLIKAIFAYIDGENVEIEDAGLSSIFNRVSKEIDSIAFILATNRRI